MDLSNEDSLRLNVLLHQEPEAIRIDESKMLVYGLSSEGEAKIQLNPNCRDEQYIKKVKEAISSHVLGSPGGYPIFLRRWTRMGQARDDSLERLLKLGEPEAVVAVVHAPGITNELARRAWWAMPDSANARCMLANQDVAAGEMGKVLADFLIEFMPFEEDPKAVIESVRLVLQPGLISEADRQGLWSRGQRKNVFLVGFLKTTPDDLPEQGTPHPEYARYAEQLAELASRGQPMARSLLRVLGPAGQAFLQTTAAVMKKPSNQDVVVALLEAIEAYFATIRFSEPASQDVTELVRQAEHCCGEGQVTEIREVLATCPDAEELISAMLSLGWCGVPVVNPIFAHTDAIGTVMRRKLEPVSQPILKQIAVLTGK